MRIRGGIAAATLVTTLNMYAEGGYWTYGGAALAGLFTALVMEKRA